MKQHFKTIKKVETYLQKKYGILTENSSSDESFNDWDISITGVTKNNLISTFTIKPNSSYNNNKVCIEVARLVNGEFVPSGIGAVNSEYVILAFYDDTNLYLIKRQKLMEYSLTIKNQIVPKYFANDKNGCRLALLDRPSLLNKCRVL